MLKIFLQSLLGLLVVIAAYVAGVFVSVLVPGANASKYLNPLGEVIVATLIFLFTLTLGVLAHFKPSVLFLTVGLAAFFEMFVLLLLFRDCSDMEIIGGHTLPPVAMAAIVILFIRMKRDNQNAA